MPRKLKVIDINNNEPNSGTEELNNEVVVESQNIENNNNVEENTDKNIVENIAAQDNTVEENTIDNHPKTQETESTQNNKAVRTQELVKCERCGRMLTAKTLRYSHAQTCGVDKIRNKVGRKTNAELAEKRELEKQTKKEETVPQYVPPKENVPPPQPTISLHEYHRLMREERQKQRNEKMKNLFSSAFK